MNKKIYLVFGMLFLFSLSFASAQLGFLGTFEQDQEVNLIQLCANCTFNNITSVNSPNSTELIANVVMDKGGTSYNYTLLNNNTREVGIYNVNGFGDPNGIIQIWSYPFEITKTGKSFETGESLLLIVLIISVFIFFCLSFYFALATPYGNDISENGMVIKVTKLKYVKLFFIMLTYVMFVWFLNVLIGVSDNFISLSLFSGFIGFLFEALNRLAWPFAAFIIVLCFFEIIRDANFNKNMAGLMRAMN